MTPIDQEPGALRVPPAAAAVLRIEQLGCGFATESLLKGPGSKVRPEGCGAVRGRTGKLVDHCTQVAHADGQKATPGWIGARLAGKGRRKIRRQFRDGHRARPHA